MTGTIIYWGFFLTGVSIALITVIFGEIIGSIFDGIFDFFSLDGPDFLNPMVIFGGMTVFGGSGIVLTKYTSLHSVAIAIVSLLLAIFLSTLVFFYYVKPMQNAENSTSFSMNDLTGQIGEIITPVPASGYGEILIRAGAGNTNQIAASFDNEELLAGTRVVVIEIKDGVLYVSRFEDIK